MKKQQRPFFMAVWGAVFLSVGNGSAGFLASFPGADLSARGGMAVLEKPGAVVEPPALPGKGVPGHFPLDGRLYSSMGHFFFLHTAGG